MNSPALSIVIPAYNEAGRILSTLQAIQTFIDKQPYTTEVIVVDDCSTDKTRDIVTAFIAGKNNFVLDVNNQNRGKGASVKKGMLKARGTIRLFCDADLSTPIDEVQKFLPLMENYDIVIGSRRVAGAHVVKRQPIYREASGRVFSILVRILVLRNFLDTQCGFKMFTAQAADAIFPQLTIERFGFDVEVLYIAQEILGLKVKEMPVSWFDSPNSHVRLWRDATRMFLDLLQIRCKPARKRGGGTG